MGTAAWAIPVGVLAGIVVIALAFFWWWFPRTWQKGVNADAKMTEEAGVSEDNEERAAARAAHRAHSHQVVQRALEAERARKRGDVVEIFNAVELDEYGVPIKPPGYSAV